MTLPRPLYEALPYFCLGLGLTLLIATDAPVLLAWGLVLYVAGAGIWIARSNYRRRDGTLSCRRVRRAKPLPYSHTRHWVPESLYEWLPFLYVGLGVASAQVYALLGLPSALLLMAAGLLVLRMRRRNRACEDEVMAAQPR